MIDWQNDPLPYEQKSVALIFNTQLDELERRYPVVSDLLKVLSCLDPERIPRDMIAVGAEVLQSWSTSNVNSLCICPLDGEVNNKSAISSKLTPLIALIRSPMKFHLAIQQLQRLSQIHYESNVDTFVLGIHDLVRIMIQDSSLRA